MGANVDRVAFTWEAKFAEAAEQQFQADLDALLAIIKESARTIKAKIDWLTVGKKWEAYFQEAGDRWREAFVPLIQGVVTDQGEAWNLAFGMEFDVQNLFALEWFDEYTLQFAQPIMATTLKDTTNLYRQAMLEGWSIPQMDRHLGQIFQQYMQGDLAPDDFAWFEDRMPPHRRELISRTETLRASNAGSFELFKQWGAPLKEWLATGDSRTRDTHMDAWARYQEGGNPGPIPIDEPFIVGGAEMMYPHDPNGPAKEVISCRCTLLPFNPAWMEL